MRPVKIRWTTADRLRQAFAWGVTEVVAAQGHVDIGELCEQRYESTDIYRTRWFQPGEPDRGYIRDYPPEVFVSAHSKDFKVLCFATVIKCLF
jgi:hypothetical protein